MRVNTTGLSPHPKYLCDEASVPGGVADYSRDASKSVVGESSVLNRLVGMWSGNREKTVAPPLLRVEAVEPEPAARPAGKAPSVMRREAMLGRDQRVAGYTFLLRRTADEHPDPNLPDVQRLYDETLLGNLQRMDIARLLGQRLAFVPISPATLDHPLIEEWPATGTVWLLNVDPLTTMDASLPARLAELKPRGFSFAVRADAGSLPHVPQAAARAVHGAVHHPPRKPRQPGHGTVARQGAGPDEPGAYRCRAAGTGRPIPPRPGVVGTPAALRQLARHGPDEQDRRHRTGIDGDGAGQALSLADADPVYRRPDPGARPGRAGECPGARAGGRTAGRPRPVCQGTRRNFCRRAVFLAGRRDAHADGAGIEADQPAGRDHRGHRLAARPVCPLSGAGHCLRTGRPEQHRSPGQADRTRRGRHQWRAHGCAVVGAAAVRRRMT